MRDVDYFLAALAILSCLAALAFLLVIGLTL